MASNSTISISFKIADGADGLKKLTVDAEALRKVMKETVDVSIGLKKNIINFAALCTGIDSVSNSFNNLQSTLRSLTDAYAAQIEAETKLATVMRNTMGAREEDIQSIKDLCSVQQELGVIGDEVQLAGAQELATYLTKKQSLEQLIPVMNDMLAQQYGLNATQENAINIATMLGKVMDGQTGALSRYGYSFDEIQEKILKFGTESECAAVLCDVVSSSVGGMNAELAKTDVGKQKQLDNTLGDIKEKLGGFVEAALPFVSLAASTTTAAGGVMKLYRGITVAITTLKGWHIAQTATNLVIRATGLYSQQTASQLTALQASATGTQRAMFGLQIAIRGLLMTSVVGAALVGLVWIISELTSSSNNATDSTNRLLNAEEQAKRDAEQLDQMRQQENSTLTSTRAALEINISKLKDFHGTKEQEKKIVSEMNDTYGDTMGYFSSVSDWYNALVSNSEAYCKQMVIEARTRMLANQIATKEQENHDIIYDDAGNKHRYSTKREREQITECGYDIHGNRFDYLAYGKEIEGTSDLDKAEAKVRANNKAIANLRKQLHAAGKEAAEIDFKIKGASKRPDVSLGSKSVKKGSKEELVNPKELKTLDDFDAKLRYLDSKRGKASKDRLKEIDSEIKKVKQLRDAFEGKDSPKIAPKKASELNSLKELSDAESYWREIQQKGSKKEILQAQEEIDLIDKRKDALMSLTELPSLKSESLDIQKEVEGLSGLEGRDLDIRLKAIGTEKLKVQLDTVNKTIDSICKSMAQFGIGSEEYEELRTLRESLRGTRDELTGFIEQSGKNEQSNSAQLESVSQLSSAFGQLGSSIGGAAGQWISYGANVAQAITAAIPQILALTTAQKTEGAEAGAAAATKAASAVAGIPFVGPALAVAAIASVVAAIAAIPKFANGGIAYGPTLGLFGEYAGASNNPEVVAPLNKLRNLIQPGEGINSGTVKFKIEGRTLVGVLEKESNLRSRS